VSASARCLSRRSPLRRASHPVGCSPATLRLAGRGEEPLPQTHAGNAVRHSASNQSRSNGRGPPAPASADANGRSLADLQLPGGVVTQPALGRLSAHRPPTPVRGWDSGRSQRVEPARVGLGASGGHRAKYSLVAIAFSRASIAGFLARSSSSALAGVACAGSERSGHVGEESVQLRPAGPPSTRRCSRSAGTPSWRPRRRWASRVTPVLHPQRVSVRRRLHHPAEDAR